MKLKNYWKRFWTLDRHHAEGFTLVELIVVIAILAILAGVGIPVYSGYITKANKQADMTLISEIEHALELAYYNGDLTDGEAGFILLQVTAPTDDSFYDTNVDIDLAMENAFGSNWEQMMQLKYENWGVKHQTLTYEEAKKIVNSTYVQNFTPDELMGQVQSVIDAVNGLDLEGTTGTDLWTMFNYTDGQNNNNAISDVMKTYGVGGEFDTTEEAKVAFDALTDAEKSNLMVLATASSVSNNQGARAAAVITEFALYTGFATVNPEFKTQYDSFVEKINNPPEGTTYTTDEIKQFYREMRSQAESATGYSEYMATKDNDLKAFNSIMNGVGNAMDDNGDEILKDLSSNSMFTTGAGNGLYKDFLDTAYASAGAAGSDVSGSYGGSDMVGLIPNSVVVWYSVMNGMIYVENSMPVS